MVTNLLDFRLFRNVKTYEKYTCVFVELFGTKHVLVTLKLWYSFNGDHKPSCICS